MTNSSPISFEQDISLADIKRFIAADDRMPIMVWSIQTLCVLEALNRQGFLKGDEKYIFNDNKPGKKTAYEWMRKMMAKRLSDYKQEWPVWTLLSHPKSPFNQPHCKLLRIIVPKSRVLVSFYHPWTKLLQVMALIEKNEGQWPAPWLHYYPNSPDFCPTEVQHNADQPMPSYFDEQNCRLTWEKIFELTLFRKGFGWDKTPDFPLLQGMVPVIYATEVVEVTEV